MKKIIALAVMAVMLVASVAITASADTYNPALHCSEAFNLKKANPECVVKDGIIGDGEYERLNVDLGLESTDLNINFGNPLVYDYAEALVSTMQYFFSWDDVHGFNMAVRWKPTHPVQLLEAADSYPRDRFMCNASVSFSTDTSCIQGKDDTFFYYSMARRSDDGRYLFADYGQLGMKGQYEPKEGEYIINYEPDGYITCEWSIPLDNLVASTADGTEIYFSLVAGSGTGTPDMENSEDGILKTFYNISLGDYGFGTKRDKTSANVIAIISSEAIPYTGNGNQTDGPSTDPKPTPDMTQDNPGTGNETPSNTPSQPTNDPGNTAVTPSGNNTNPTGNNTYAPNTGDPAVIMAIVSAISACGYAVRKKIK